MHCTQLDDGGAHDARQHQRLLQRFVGFGQIVAVAPLDRHLPVCVVFWLFLALIQVKRPEKREREKKGKRKREPMRADLGAGALVQALKDNAFAATRHFAVQLVLLHVRLAHRWRSLLSCGSKKKTPPRGVRGTKKVNLAASNRR